jgi:hypothetical protein
VKEFPNWTEIRKKFKRVGLYSYLIKQCMYLMFEIIIYIQADCIREGKTGKSKPSNSIFAVSNCFKNLQKSSLTTDASDSISTSLISLSNKNTTSSIIKGNKRRMGKLLKENHSLIFFVYKYWICINR